MNRNDVLNMPVEELSIHVAEKIFKAFIAIDEFDGDVKYLLVGDVGYNSVQPLKEKKHQFAKWRNSEEKAWLDCPRYAENMSDAWEMEEKIKWMSRTSPLYIGYYMMELTIIIGNTGFDLLHASPKQRCQAALIVMLEV